jgi:S-adenosylmethionine decarboxylase
MKSYTQGVQQMKNIAPEIFRQRLLVEAYYQAHIDIILTEKYLIELAAHLGLSTYAKPIVHVTGDVGDNQGFDGFVPLVDSGIAVYVWTAKKFMSTVLYTCKEFEVERAVEFIEHYFNVTDEIVWKDF